MQSTKEKYQNKEQNVLYLDMKNQVIAINTVHMTTSTKIKMLKKKLDVGFWSKWEKEEKKEKLEHIEK